MTGQDFEGAWQRFQYAIGLTVCLLGLLGLVAMLAAPALLDIAFSPWFFFPVTAIFYLLAPSLRRRLPLRRKSRRW